MGTLILQDGSVIKGNSFGAIGGFEGEVTFSTSQVGYQEIITDCAYSNQIVIMAYPEIGNVGINDFDSESDKARIVGLIVKSYSKDESHYRSKESLSNYLKNNNIIALDNIDTRNLIKKISKNGEMSGFITSNDVDNNFIREKIQELQKFEIKKNLIEEVSCKTRYIYNPQGTINLALLDYGVKRSLLAQLAKVDCRITILPATTEASEILKNHYDALFLSSGPSNPNKCNFQISQIKQLLGKIPMFATALGCELLAIASGATVKKAKGNSLGNNFPVINLENNKIMIVNKNHNYKIQDDENIKFMRQTYKNLNDNSIEGFEIESLSVYAVQFNPEGAPGSEDGLIIFREWANLMKKGINKTNEVEEDER